MTAHSYPANALIGDYGRAAAGFAIVALPLATVELAPWVATVLGALAALFAAFGLRTATRQASRIELDDNGIATSGWRRKRLDWTRLERVKLGFYTTKRDGSNGWMQLALRGAGGRLIIDSRIEDFEAIVHAAAAAARARGLKVSPATAANFAAYGVEVDAA
jgi:hypothetical protein